MTICRHGAVAGSSSPLHLPSDDLPRVDGVRPPEERPGPSMLTGEPTSGPLPSYAKTGQHKRDGRRTPARKPRS